MGCRLGGQTVAAVGGAGTQTPVGTPGRRPGAGGGSWSAWRRFLIRLVRGRRRMPVARRGPGLPKAFLDRNEELLEGGQAIAGSAFIATTCIHPERRVFFLSTPARTGGSRGTAWFRGSGFGSHFPNVRFVRAVKRSIGGHFVGLDWFTGAAPPVRKPQSRARGIRVALRRCRNGSPGVTCSAPGILLQDARLAD